MAIGVFKQMGEYVDKYIQPNSNFENDGPTNIKQGRYYVPYFGDKYSSIYRLDVDAKGMVTELVHLGIMTSKKVLYNEKGTFYAHERTKGYFSTIEPDGTCIMTDANGNEALRKFTLREVAKSDGVLFEEWMYDEIDLVPRFVQQVKYVRYIEFVQPRGKAFRIALESARLLVDNIKRSRGDFWDTQHSEVTKLEYNMLIKLGVLTEPRTNWYRPGYNYKRFVQMVEKATTASASAFETLPGDL